MTTISKYDYKVLPFDTAQGHVPGHEIRCYHYDWMDDFSNVKHDEIMYVVFTTFDRKADMELDVVVHYQKWTQYAKKHWPVGGRISAVIMRSGRRFQATTYAVGFPQDGDYDRAPIICRDEYKIVELMSREPLLEVVGVEDWMRHGKPLVDPWKRENEEFAARMRGEVICK